MAREGRRRTRLRRPWATEAVDVTCSCGSRTAHDALIYEEACIGCRRLEALAQVGGDGLDDEREAAARVCERALEEAARARSEARRVEAVCEANERRERW